MSDFSDTFKGRRKPPKPVEWKPRPEILLTDRIPLPMWGTAPRVVLGENWWNRERRKAYKTTDFHCIACGVHKTKAAYHQWLEGHEVYEIDYLLGKMEYIECVPLCHFCHNYIHQGRLNNLLEKGKIHHAKFVAIVQHGDKVLAANRLEKVLTPTEETQLTVLWNEWRLVIGKDEYPPTYGSEAECRKAFAW